VEKRRGVGRDPFAESTKRYDILLKLLTDNNPTADDEATLMWICRQAWVNQ